MNVSPGVSPQHAFSKVPQADINRSSFDRSHGHKTTFDAGYLVPFYVDEAYPGDTFNLQPTVLARLATPIKALMDELTLTVHFFSVPLRLLWTNFPKFMGEQVDPGDSIDYTIPMMTAPVGGYDVGSLQDYMGLPTDVAGYEHSAMWLRAYNLIYNTWYRDQNLIDSAVVDLGDAGGTVTNYVLRRRGKRHDYFTSALPWPQKGDAVTLPLVNDPIPVTLNATTGLKPLVRLASTHAIPGGNNALYEDNSGGANTGQFTIAGSGHAVLDPQGSLEVDMSTATAVTINALRLAITVQQLLERDARGGTRLTEIIHSHFGVVSPDARMQRPEYLGGGDIPVIVQPLAQTAPESGGSTPQGNIAGFGTAVNSGGLGFVQSFTEHSVILGIVSARAAYTYQQGLNRMWSRETRYDFYFPVFANLGEQTVLNKELYTQGTADDALAFGYQERWAELRYKPSLVTGLFRSTAATSLDVWHLAQEFTALPLLNQDFIEENPPIDRVIAVPSEPHFIFDSFIKLNCVRPLPTFSVPGLRVL